MGSLTKLNSSESTVGYACTDYEAETSVCSLCMNDALVLISKLQRKTTTRPKIKQLVWLPFQLGCVVY